MKIKTRRYYIYYLLRVSFFVLGLVPLRIGLFIADLFGKAAFKFLGKYRDIALNNLNRVFSKGLKRNQKIARGVFSNLAKNGAEWVKLFFLRPKDLTLLITELEGFERIDKALERGKGLIGLSFHFGNWELLPIYLKSLGYEGGVIARRIYFYKYNKLIESMRLRFGLETIYRDESPKKMIRVLKNNGILGIVPDQDVDSIDGVFVDFFGQEAYTPTAPVKLAIATGASFMPIFVVRKKDNTHKIIFEEPIDMSGSTGREEDIKKFTQEWSGCLEKYVRKYPDQWVWLHKRWKTRPEDVKV